MELSPELMHQVLSLPVSQRYELAHQLLDSIDDSAHDLDQELLVELRRRREEMMRGEETINDWRMALSSIESSFRMGRQD